MHLATVKSFDHTSSADGAIAVGILSPSRIQYRNSYAMTLQPSVASAELVADSVLSGVLGWLRTPDSSTTSHVPACVAAHPSSLSAARGAGQDR
jgi:hypothetical protein